MAIGYPTKLHSANDCFRKGESYSIGTGVWYIGFEGASGNGGSFTIPLPKSIPSILTVSSTLTTDLIRSNGNDMSNPSISNVTGTGYRLNITFSHTATSDASKQPAAIRINSGNITFN